MITHNYYRYAVAVKKDGEQIGWMGYVYREFTKDIDQASKFDSSNDAEWAIEVVQDQDHGFGDNELVITPIVETVVKTFEAKNHYD